MKRRRGGKGREGDPVACLTGRAMGIERTENNRWDEQKK